MKTEDVLYELMAEVVPKKHIKKNLYINVNVTTTHVDFAYDLIINCGEIPEVTVLCRDINHVQLLVEYPQPEFNIIEEYNLSDPDDVSCIQKSFKGHYKKARREFWLIMWPFWPIVKFWEIFK